jgi:hypothetical protein
MLIRVNGDEDHGWRGSAFWWPVIMAPENASVIIFAGETLNNQN